MFRFLRSVFPAFALFVFVAGVASAQTCSVTLGSTSASVVAAGGTGSFNVSAAAGCDWTAVSNAPAWLTISFGQTGSQNGSVGFRASPNDANTARSGTITVNDRTFTVNQAAGSCTYTVTVPTGSTTSFGPEGGSGSLELVTLRGCAWQATTLASWITIATPSGTGPATINFTVAPGTAQRSGFINVQSERVTITQAAPCSFSVGSVAPVSGNGATVNLSVTVASGSNCLREATSQADWIRITSGASATGAGTIVLAVSANTSALPRQGTITINGTLVVTLFQQGNSCTFTLVPATATAVQTGGVGTISVQTQSGCAWTATPQVDWLAVTSSGTGTGNGTVTYSVAQNLTSEQRTGFISIGSRSFQVTQAGLGCTIRVDNNDVAVGSEGGSGTFTVAALTSCSWTATSQAAWLRITSGASGSGSAEVTFTADRNPTNQARTGTILVGTAPVSVRQAAGSCQVTVTPSQTNFPATGGTARIDVESGCAWTATKSSNWIVLGAEGGGTGTSALTFSVSANTAAEDRSGTITVAGQTVAITQTGQRCSLSLSTTSATIPARGGNGSFNVTGGSSCSWTAAARDPWLRTEFSIVNGSGVVRYSAPPNTTGSARTTTVTVSGQQVSVVQPPIEITIGVDGVVNAASFAGGAVAPGEIVTIYGSGFGPALLAGLELTANRQAITSVIGDTRVLFDGVASPMVYTVDGQLSAIVPYAVAGKPTTVLEVEYLGVKSNAVTLQVAATAPGIFTLTQNGRGQGAVLNQDSSLNGPGAAGAQRNTVIQIFGTGEGQTRPVGVDGKLTVAPLPVPVAGVRVFVGGVEAAVTYAGGAPGLVAGLVQVNARLAANTPLGDAVPLEVRINGVASQAGVTIGVR